MRKTIIKEIYKKIRKYKTIVIARHISPDPDAIASQTSLRDSIKLTFPEKTVLAVGSGVSKFKYYGTLDKVDDSTLSNALLIVCDVPNIHRIDGTDYTKYDEVIKIDHHPKEDKFATIDFVDETASSACQMIIEILLNTPLKINTKIAENLYLGVVSDSDRFLLPYTSTKTFKLIIELIEKTKIDFTSLYASLYERSINEIRFQNFIGENLTITKNGLAYMKIKAEDIKRFEVDNSTASNMINSFNFIKGVKVWTFITYDERSKLHKVNIRSRGPIINTIASKYNGGGHKFASGARIPDEESVDMMISDLDQVCIEYSKNN